MGRIIGNEAGVIVERGPDTVRGADVAYLSYRRIPKGKVWNGFLRKPPELIAEVLAADQPWKEMETKVAEYHAFGVDLVWVADPQTETVRVYPKGGRPSVLQRDGQLTAGDILPGFSCKVSEFFAD
jgi:Uma2 family endonuclease